MNVMGKFEWDEAEAAVQAQQEPPKQARTAGSVIGTIAFIIVAFVGVAAAAAFVNVLTLGDRMRDHLSDQACEDSVCRVQILQRHNDCLMDHVYFKMPASMADFDTPKESPRLGVAKVDAERYKRCVIPKERKTLAEEP